jgi:hypothetical protein
MRFHVYALAFLAAGCGGSTSGSLVSFTALAGGPEDAAAGLTFDTQLGFHVVLDRAVIHIGALYLTDIQPSSGIGQEPCTIPSGQNAAYVAEAYAPANGTIDLLSPQLAAFPTPGEGVAIQSKTAQVWLTGGDVNAPTDPTVILDVAGTASQGTTSFPFVGSVTISSNRAIPVGDPALPGSNPICQQRIVQPIQVQILPTEGGQLQLRVDPRPMFHVVDFSTLSLVPGSTSQYLIPDTSAGAGQALYKGMLSSADVYTFSWSN